MTGGDDQPAPAPPERQRRDVVEDDDSGGIEGMSADELAADTEDMVRFSSHLAQRYLEQRRQMSQPLMDDGDDDLVENGMSARRRAPLAARGEGCPCRVVASFDLLLGLALSIYGLAMPMVVLIRGTFYHHKTAVPIWAVLISLVLGSVLLRSSTTGRWPSPLAAAICEVAIAIYAGVKWTVLEDYLADHREAMLLSHKFVREAREDPRVRAWFVAASSVLAALEVCRGLALAREARLDAIRRSQSPPPGGSYRRLVEDSGVEEGAGREDEEGGWDAAANAARWEQWRRECDPGLRDRSGNYDPDAMRRDGSPVPQEDGRDSLTEPLIGPRQFVDGGGGAGLGGVESPHLGREESFEVRHGLSRRGRGRPKDDRGGGGGSGLLSSLKFWNRSSSGTDGGAGSADAHSLGEGSSAGFAPVEGEVPEPGAGGSASIWPAAPTSLRDG